MLLISKWCYLHYVRQKDATTYVLAIKDPINIIFYFDK